MSLKTRAHDASRSSNRAKAVRAMAGSSAPFIPFARTSLIDDTKLTDEQVRSLSVAARDIVSSVTDIEDVFVYADSPRIKIAVAPVEVFVSISEHKVTNRDLLFQELRDRIAEWKEQTTFPQPINLTLIPMPWKFETGI